MFFSLRVLLGSLVFAGFLSTVCMADLAILNEEELGNFVAEEGVCDFRLPDACNTDPELAETLSKNTRDFNKTVTNLKADVVHALQVSQINPNSMQPGALIDTSVFSKHKMPPMDLMKYSKPDTSTLMNQATLPTIPTAMYIQPH